MGWQRMNRWRDRLIDEGTDRQTDRQTVDLRDGGVSRETDNGMMEGGKTDRQTYR